MFVFCAICLRERTVTPCPHCGTDDAAWTKLGADNMPANNDRCDVAFIAGTQRSDWRFLNGVFEAPPRDREFYSDAAPDEVFAWRLHDPGRPEKDYLKLPRKKRLEALGVNPAKRKV